MKWFALLLLMSTPTWADEPTPQEQPQAAVVAQPEAPPVPSHPQGVEKSMGVIQGGWGYVYASYGAGLLGLVVYAASLFVRRSSQSSERHPS